MCTSSFSLFSNAKNVVYFTETNKCSHVPSPLPNLRLFSTVWCPLGFKNARMTEIRCLQASDFESDVNYFRGFLHRYTFPYFRTRFLTDFFIFDTQISTGNTYRFLKKQTCQCLCPHLLATQHTLSPFQRSSADYS